MDATPVTLGQEFSAYGLQVRRSGERLLGVLPDLDELALGGTAVGTGINAPPGFAASVVRLIAEETGYPFREAENHFEAQSAKDAVVLASGALKTAAGVAVQDRQRPALALVGAPAPVWPRFGFRPSSPGLRSCRAR